MTKLRAALLILVFCLFFIPGVFAMQSTSTVIEVPRDCPQLAPVHPDFCKDGTLIDGGINSNRCPKGPICIIDNASTCPVNCTCQGSVIVCPVTGTSGTVEERVVITRSSGVCPVGCVCEGEKQTCKGKEIKSETPTTSGESPICPSNCTCEEGKPIICSSSSGVRQTTDELMTPVEPKMCPVGCICQNDITVCPSSTSPISTTLEQGESKIKVVINQSSEGQTKMTIPESNIEIVGNVSIINNQLMGGQGDDVRKILLPTDLEKPLQTESIKKVTLLEPDSKTPYSRYQIKEIQRGKLLNILPVSYQVTSSINAETGKTISAEKPFWSALVK